MDHLANLWNRRPLTAVPAAHDLAEAVHLGHSIVVPSRRAGHILEFDTPLAKRQFGDPDLKRHRRCLRILMRDEARAAEMLGAEHGSGACVPEAGSLHDLQRLFAGVVVRSVPGVRASATNSLLERRLPGWRT